MPNPGTNPTLLVPGLAGGNAPFKPFRDALRAGGIDAECWKRSPILYRRSFAWHGERLAEDLAALRDTVRQPLTVVGWSKGGPVILAAMRRLTERFGDPASIVGHVITYASPLEGTWAARAGRITDRVIPLSISEMRPGSPVLEDMVAFLHLPRRWRFHAVYGTRDLLVRPARRSLRPEWCRYGPWHHMSLLWDLNLFEVIHTLIELP